MKHSFDKFDRFDENGRKRSKRRDHHRTDSDSEKRSFSQRVRRVGDLFRAETQKEKVLRHEDFNGAGDVYYANVAVGYKIAQRVLVLIFVVLLIFSIATNYREITYDNFYYLIKNFAGAADTGGSEYETLSYESDDRQSFALYRGGLATVSPSRMSVFTSTGRRTLNTTATYSSPYIVSSSRYLLVYDTAGTTFSLYNSFAKIYTETLEYPITDAALGEDGSFAVVTRSAHDRAVIRVYDRDFKLCLEIGADYHVFDVALDSERRFLTTLSYTAGNGIGRSTLSVWDLDNMEMEEKYAELSFDGEFPLACGFLEGDSFAVLTDCRARVLDRSFEETENGGDYFGADITGYSLNEQGMAVALTSASEHSVIAFDRSGNLLYQDTVSFYVSDISVCGRYIFLQTEDGVARLSPDEGESEMLASGQGTMLVYNERTALVCGQSKAEYLIFGGR